MSAVHHETSCHDISDTAKEFGKAGGDHADTHTPSKQIDIMESPNGVVSNHRKIVSSS